MFLILKKILYIFFLIKIKFSINIIFKNLYYIFLNLYNKIELNIKLYILK